MINLEASITRFNYDPELKYLREYYSEKPFMEIMSKSRDVAAHNAFLAWLLEGKDFSSKNLPLLHFCFIILMNSGGVKVSNTFEAFSNAFYSKKLRFGKVEAYTDKCVKDISDVKSRDKIDLFVKAEVDGVKGIDYIGIVLINDINPVAFEKPKLHDVDGAYAKEYNALSQDRRLTYAYSDDKAYDKHKRVLRLFVYLSTYHCRCLEPESDRIYFRMAYSELFSFMLSNLAADNSLSERVRFMLNEYMRSYAVPAPSDENDDYTTFFTDTREKEGLIKMWADYKDMILASSPVRESLLNTEQEKAMASVFWNENRLLLHALYEENRSEMTPEEKECFEPVSCRDYGRYSVCFESETIRNLSRRKVVLLVVEKLITEKKLAHDNEIFTRMMKDRRIVYERAKFLGSLLDDNYYTPILNETYYVYNRWGVANFDDFLEAVESSTSIIIKG